MAWVAIGCTASGGEKGMFCLSWNWSVLPLRNGEDMTKQREHLTPEGKVAILRRHLVERVAVSTVCEEAAVRPSQFYQWHRQFFENVAAAFQPSPRSRPDQAQQRIAVLEHKLQTKNRVLAELMEQYIALKVSLNQ